MLWLSLSSCATDRQDTFTDDVLIDLTGDRTPHDGAGNAITERELAADIDLYTIGEILYLNASISGAYIYEPRLILLRDWEQLDALFAEKGIPTAYDRYGKSFFAAHDLVLIGVESSSGSTRYEVTHLGRNADGELSLDLTRLVDGASDDTGHWLITVPIPKNAITDGEQMHVREITRDDLDVDTTVADAVCIGSSLHGLHDEPLSRPIVLQNAEEIAQFAAWYGLETQYAAYLGAEEFDPGRALLIVPVRAEFSDTTWEVSRVHNDFGYPDVTLTVDIVERPGSERISDQAYHLVIPFRLSERSIANIDVRVTRATEIGERADHILDERTAVVKDTYIHADALPQLVKDTAALSALVKEYDLRQENLSAFDNAFFAENDLILYRFHSAYSDSRYRVASLYRDELSRWVLTVEETVQGEETAIGHWIAVAPVRKGMIEDARDIYINTTTFQPETYAGKGIETLHIDSYHDLVIPNSRYLCLESVEQLALLCRINGFRTESDTTYAAYDEAFFATHDLLLIPRTEGSGSIRHNIFALRTTKQGLSLDIARLSPPNVTGDMAYWTFLVPIEKGALPKDSTLNIRYTDINIATLPIERIATD